MKIYNKILTFILWLSLLLTGGGCGSRSNEPEIGDPDDDGPKIFVTFNVAVPKISGSPTRSEGTRAEGDLKTWEDTPLDREPGDDFDRLVLKNNFTAVIYKTQDNSLAAKITDLKVNYTDDNSSTTYLLNFQGVLDTEITKEEFEKTGKDDFKIMILANIPEAFDPVTGNMEELVFSRKGRPGTELVQNEEGKERFHAIPMWGVKAVTLNKLETTENHNYPVINYICKDDQDKIQPVYLLRAMAMVRVQLHEVLKNEGVELVSLTLNRHNESGYVVPSKWNEILDTKNLRLDQTLRENNSVTQTEMPVYVVTDDEKSDIRFYLPEVANSKNAGSDSDDSDVAELILTAEYIENGEHKTGEIKFRDYENGKPVEGGEPYDIVRNHIYEFTIIKTYGIELEVKEWNYWQHPQIFM